MADASAPNAATALSLFTLAFLTILGSDFRPFSLAAAAPSNASSTRQLTPTGSAENSSTAPLPNPSQSFDLLKYLRYGEILRYLSQVHEDYSDVTNLFTVAISTEGRPVIGIKIGIDTGMNKSAVWIDGGIHAREWISPAVALNIISGLVTAYNTDQDINALLHAFDWYIVPCVNPDGYEFSWDYKRYWRKTRSNQTCDRDGCCVGVDLNRNFGYKWGGAGASDLPCADDYRGLTPFSEPESRGLADYLLRLTPRLQLFITMHSYGAMWLIPYGYTNRRRPPNYHELHRLASVASNAIYLESGVRYRIMQSSGLYEASGASDDWALEVADAAYTFTLELRPNTLEDAYRHFSPAPTRIAAAAHEAFVGVRAMAADLLACNATLGRCRNDAAHTPAAAAAAVAAADATRALTLSVTVALLLAHCIVAL